MKTYLIPFLFLIFACNSNKAITETASSSQIEVSNKKISFYLTNDSEKSIPLLIPSVMNPNLSPNSSSSVVLRIGQEVFFKYKLKRYLLIKVDDSIKSGDKIEVSELLSKRKKELGLN